jgi:hypothetical protein
MQKYLLILLLIHIKAYSLDLDTTELDYDWLQSNNSLATSINDAIYTNNKIGINTNTPAYGVDAITSQIRVQASSISGGGNAGVILDKIRNNGTSGKIIFLGASGTNTFIKFDNTASFYFSSDTRVNIEDPTGIGDVIFEINPNKDITLHGYSNVREDSALVTPQNILYTDINGRLLSTSINNIVNSGGTTRLIKVNFDTTTDIATYIDGNYPISGTSILDGFTNPTTSILIPENGIYNINGVIELIKENTAVSYSQSTVAFYIAINGSKETVSYVTNFESGTNEQITNVIISDKLNLVAGDTLELRYIMLYGNDSIIIRNNSTLSHLTLTKE